MASLSRNYPRFLGAVLLVTVWSSSATAADQGEGEPVVAAAFGAPSSFPQGPSLRETGRIGAMFPQGSGEIVRDALAVPADVTVQQVASVDRNLGRTGDEDAALTREIEARLGAAGHGCRIEVARRKQVPPSEVVSAPMTLRWTILPSGAVSSTAVIITTVDDADLAECVKTQMVSWTFRRLSGGPVNAERIFQLNQR